MSRKVIPVPEKIIINILKSLPKEKLVDIFWKTLIEIDTSPLTNEEKEEIERAKLEFERGESVNWEDIK